MYKIVKIIIDEKTKEEVKIIDNRKQKTKKVYKPIFVKHYLVANELINKGFKLTKVDKNKYCEGEYIYFFENIEGEGLSHAVNQANQKAKDSLKRIMETNFNNEG